MRFVINCIADLIVCAILTVIAYYVIYVAMHVGVYIALAKNMIPDFWSMFLVINGFSITGFISHCIAAFWNAVWAGASVAFPIGGYCILGGFFWAKEKYIRYVYFGIAICFAYMSCGQSVEWAQAEHSIYGSDQFDYSTLTLGHIVGALLGVGTGFMSAFGIKGSFSRISKKMDEEKCRNEMNKPRRNVTEKDWQNLMDSLK